MGNDKREGVVKRMISQSVLSECNPMNLIYSSGRWIYDDFIIENS